MDGSHVQGANSLVSPAIDSLQNIDGLARWAGEVGTPVLTDIHEDGIWLVGGPVLTLVLKSQVFVGSPAGISIGIVGGNNLTAFPSLAAGLERKS